MKTIAVSLRGGVLGLLFSTVLFFGTEAIAFSRAVKQDALRVTVTADPLAKHCNMVLTTVNTSQRPLTLTFATAQHFDFYVKDRHQRIIWQWSHDRVFADVQEKITLQPGEALTHKAKWKYMRNDGYRAKADSYAVMGALTARPQNVYSKPIQVQIPEEAMPTGPKRIP